MRSFDKDLADQDGKIAGDKVRQASTAAPDSTLQSGQNPFLSIDDVRDFNLKMIAMMRANAEVVFDLVQNLLAQNLASATSPAGLFGTRKGIARQEVETATMLQPQAAPQNVTAFVSALESRIEALSAQVARLESRIAAAEAAPAKVKVSFGEVPHTGWTPSKVVVLGNDSYGNLAEIPSTIEQGGFRYTGAPSFWIAVG